MEQHALDIRLLGRLEILRAGEPLSLPRSKKTRALLGYLVATGRRPSRQQLCDLLWEGPADPRAALRWSLSKLRPLVDEDNVPRLVTERDRVSFAPHGAAVDLSAVRERAGRDPAEASTEALREAAGQFRGVFLEGLDLPECYRFAAWCTAEREAVHTLRDTILCTLVGRLREQPEAALRCARDRLLIDPLSEDAHVDLMRLLGAMGRTGEALNQYERCREMLDYEFGARPSREMEAVRQSLTHAKPAPAVLSPPDATPSRLPPLAGRQRECDLLERWVEEDENTVLLLTGPPGIGKTRLLEELGAQVCAAGGRVLAGRAFDVEMTRPYGAWIDALRAVPSDQIPRALRAELAPLLPELGPASEEVTDRNRLLDAVLRLLVELAEEARPVVVLLDDLQWSDEASVALLHYVARAAAERRVLLACAARSADLEENAAARLLLHTLRRDRRLCRFGLAPLDARDTALLVQNIGAGLDTDRIFGESEGNPLFALEIARALHEGEDLRSDTLDGLIAERLAALDPQTRTVIPWIATLGRAFDLEFLAQVMRSSSFELLHAIEELERRGLLEVAASDGYDFTHDLVRRAAYRSTSLPRRRLLHLQIARTLAGPDDLDETAAGEVAHHAALGGDPELAARACIAAGRHSQRVFAYEEAASLAERGLEHLADLPEETRLSLHIDLLALYVHPGMSLCPPDLEARLPRVTAAARATGRPALVRKGFYAFGWLYYQRGEFSSALRATLDAEEAGREADPATVVEAIADTSHCLCLIEREMDRAEKLALEARSLAEEFDLEIEGSELPMALGMLRQHAGAFDEARRLAERAFQRSRHDPYPWTQFHCLSRLVMIELERGCPEEALAWCRDLIAMTEEMGDGSEAPFAAALEALARCALGDAEATADVDRAAARLRLVDSKWMLAYVQNAAAALDLESGHPEAGRRRAEDALTAAEAVGRRSEAALARALLARLSLEEDDPGAAARHLKAVQDDLAQPHALSARARRAVEKTTERLTKNQEPKTKNQPRHATRTLRSNL